ncbi:MAG: rod shape-determining protein MreC [Neisseriales bacterium]|nr:MAG: rod shape-determining protein MreC [Neisseriales bacterium]
MVYTLLALGFIALDQNFSFVKSAKRYLDGTIYSMQFVLYQPFHWMRQGSILLQNQASLGYANQQLQRQILQLTTQIDQLKVAEQELATLKRFFVLRHHLTFDHYCVGQLYRWRGSSAYQLILDKGTDFHLQHGQPVVDERGLLGQISHVYDHFATVTLIVSKGQMIPIMVERTGERAILYGQNGRLSLPYWPLQSDIRAQDRLVTSGIDGVYPAGLPVARVNHVEKDSYAHFANLDIVPLAGLFRSRYAMVLSPHARGFLLPYRDHEEVLKRPSQ